MQIDKQLTAKDLYPATTRVFDLAARKVRATDRAWDPHRGTPVFTIDGKWATRGWTEWTQGFQYGLAILAFEGTGDQKLLNLGRQRTLDVMLPHVTHIGVHDHGFNNLSTYGNLLRLITEGQTPNEEWLAENYRTAIKCSGAVQAMRYSTTSDTEPIDGGGYVYSFNGPHSLFVDTMRTIRVLSVAHQLGHVLMGENDRRINLLGRGIQHGLTTAKYIIFYGDSDHRYDVRGRTAHEAVFNRNDGNFRCRSSQQGYSPFSTWTRGLAWAMLGYAEELELLKTLAPIEIKVACGLTKNQVIKVYERAAKATCDHYIRDCTSLDGICPWDDGAPQLYKLGDWQNQISDPYNAHEPWDASAAAIAAQGLIRWGTYLGDKGKRYVQAGLSVARTLFDEPYLSTSNKHHGLLLHSVYHYPNNWDYISAGQSIPCGESSMWGDYHLLELANVIRRMADGNYYRFFDGADAR